MRKIGIFGSSFNPLHIGHLIIAEQARVRLGLDKVLFVPTGNPYHKDVEELEFDTRYEMTEESIKDNPYFEMSDIEKNISGNSYSYDVVKMLMEREEAEYYFIMGSDSLNNLKTWYKYEEFLNLVHVIVFARPNYESSKELIDELDNISYKNLYYYDDLLLEISSSYIRKSIESGYTPKYMLTDESIRYIEEHKLWKWYLNKSEKI